MSIASVLLGTLATQLLGAFWYSVFIELWLHGVGKKREDFKASHSAALRLTVVSQSALAVFMSITLR